MTVVTTFHDLREPYVFPKAGRLRHWLTATLARNSDAVVAITPEDLASLRTWLPNHNASTRLFGIPIGSNIQAPRSAPSIEERDAFRAGFGAQRGTPLLGYFGLLNQSKGLDILIAALKRLRATLPQCQLLIIGGDTGASDPSNPQTRATFFRALLEEGLEKAVLFTGHLQPSEVSLALASIDVCLLPYEGGVSLRRGSLMAALAHGCAIVTTQPATVQSGEFPSIETDLNALLVPARSPAVVADATLRLLQNPGLCDQIGRGAKALSESFNWDKIAGKHGSLYHDLASHRLKPVAA